MNMDISQVSGKFSSTQGVEMGGSGVQSGLHETLFHKNRQTSKQTKSRKEEREIDEEEKKWQLSRKSSVLYGALYECIYLTGLFYLCEARPHC